MKSIILILITLPFIFSAWGQTMFKPIVVSSTITLKPLQIFVPLKKEYKQLQLTSLPMVGNKINTKEIVISSSSIDKRVVSRLSVVQKRLLRKVITNLKRNNLVAVKNDWSLLISKFNNQAMPVDINDLINYVLNESFLESNKDLKFYAARVSNIQNMQAQAQSHLNNLLGIKASNSISASLVNDLIIDIADMEDKLEQIGDDAQLANIDLQNQLQRQQQLIQTLSNVSKTLHDTALAVIRKIG